MGKSKLERLIERIETKGLYDSRKKFYELLNIEKKLDPKKYSTGVLMRYADTILQCAYNEYLDTADDPDGIDAYITPLNRRLFGKAVEIYICVLKNKKRCEIKEPIEYDYIYDFDKKTKEYIKNLKVIARKKKIKVEAVC